jgi:Prealbumin-like fold domain
MTKRRLIAALCTSATLVTGVGIVVYADVLKGAGLRAPAASSKIDSATSAPTVRPTAKPLGTGAQTVRGLIQRLSAQGHGGSQTATSATVSTDKGDYQPGETVQITGTGFLAGEMVTLQVTHMSGLDDGAGHLPFYAFADSSGGISAQWYVDPDDSVHSIFVLTAVGATSGRQATTIFTDAFFFNNDDGGVDDINSNQVDLNQMGTDEINLPNTLGVKFNWDDTGWTGGNTGDACALFDTDVPTNGRSNYALCVKVGEKNAVHKATSLWSCNDSRSDRCAGQSLVWTTLPGAVPQPPAGTQTTCTASVTPSDPFTHGSGNVCTGSNCRTQDTVAACSIKLSEVSAQDAFLINVCTFPSDQPNSNPFDCVITPDNGFLTIVKSAEEAASTTFVFSLGTGQASQNGTNQWKIVGAGTVANQVSFRPGTYDLTEAIPSGWKLTNAQCSVSGGSTGSATATFPVTSGSAGIGSLEVKSGQETTCTFTNAKNKGTLKLQKTVVNDNGGSALAGDFTLKANNVVFVQNTATSVDPGDYALSETGPSGYTSGSWSCTGGTLNSSTVTVAAGADVVCGITNNDVAPSLTLDKIVVNNNGGSAAESAWTLTATGTNAIPTNLSGSGAAGSADVVSGSDFKADTYTLAETGPSGYTASDWVCVGGTQNGNRITLALGESATCTITNNDNAAHLTLVKQVTNDNGLNKQPSDWTLTATGPVTISGKTGETVVTSAEVSVGTYTLSESGPSGYTASAYSCVKNDGSAVSGNSITLALGDSATCTITNDDDLASPVPSTNQRLILHDSVSIPGIRNGANNRNTATATFRLYTNQLCTAQSAVLVNGNPYSETVTLSYDSANTAGTTSKGSGLTTIGVTVPAPKTTTSYYWTVEYSGDQNNSGSTTKCGVEVTTIAMSDQ